MVGSSGTFKRSVGQLNLEDVISGPIQITINVT